MKREKRQFVAVGKLVEAQLRQWKGRDCGEKGKVSALWEQLVGEEISSRSRVRRVTGGKVEVEVLSSVVLAEVKQFWKSVFLEKLKKEGMPHIRRVLFYIAEG